MLLQNVSPQLSMTPSTESLSIRLHDDANQPPARLRHPVYSGSSKKRCSGTTTTIPVSVT